MKKHLCRWLYRFQATPWDRIAAIMFTSAMWAIFIVSAILCFIDMARVI